MVNTKIIFRRLYILKNQVTLRADHKNIEDEQFPISEVKELWRVRYVFCKRIPDFTHTFDDKISFIEQELEKIKNKLN